MNSRLLIIALLAGVAGGCGGREHLNELYGRRTGGGANSINGTSALGELFKQAGHRVRSWRYLSPSLDDADVVVWLPHDAWSNQIAAPSAEAVAWLDDWLMLSNTGKTLVYVGRDWEAAAEYWAVTRAAAPTPQRREFARNQTEAESDDMRRVQATPDPAECGWFTIERGNSKTSVKTLTGPFADGVDAPRADLEHWAALAATPDDATTLLADGLGHPLVLEARFGLNEYGWANEESRLILVENAGFLLNGALVNPERRKLAGRLVDHLGPAPKRVVFLETEPSPTIRETDPNPRPPTGLELFGIWPIGLVLAQAAALGIVYALTRWPVFGTPRRLRPPSLTDFGRHVHALARLLAATRDRSYAVSQLNTYFQTGPARSRAIQQHQSLAKPPARNPAADSAGDPPPQATTTTDHNNA